MRLGWYIRRLRSMGPAEILHRVAEKARALRSRGRHEGWARYGAGPGELRALPGLREALLTADTVQRDAIARAAGSSRAGRFDALGVEWPLRDPGNLFPSTLWTLDPVSGGNWPGPDTYCLDIDFRHAPGLGDVKYVWEINRLQFLVALAANAALSGGDASAVDAAIARWHAANPPFRGPGWASGIEVALRAISLMTAATLLGDRLQVETRGRVTEILRASAFWLERFPSRFSSANNHRVAELAGLFLIATALGTDPGAARAELLDEVQRQVLPDGAGAEQSPTYAAFTVELALLAASVARAGDTPFPAPFDARIAAFAEWVRWLGGEGKTPAIGDDDEGRVLTLGAPEADYARSVAAAVAGYLGVPGLVPEPDDIRGVFFGWPTAALAAPQGLKTFPEGGSSVWRGELAGRRVGLVFDHGPLGYLSIAAHGHADTLSLLLSVDGLPVLVDPGTYLYGSGGPWRAWFRSTAAHNTLTLERADQSVMSGPFNWAEKAVATLEAAEATPELRLAARHDGYRRRFGAIHRRHVESRADGIAIIDRLEGGAARPASISFQLAPDLAATVDGSTVTVRRGDETVLTLVMPGPEILSVSGVDLPEPRGWVAPRFGMKAPATQLVWRGQVGPAGVTTLLRLF